MHEKVTEREHLFDGMSLINRKYEQEGKFSTSGALFTHVKQWLKKWSEAKIEEEVYVWELS